MVIRHSQKNQEARDALTPDQQAALDAQETIIPDPRGPCVQKKQADTRSRLERLLAYVGGYIPFGTKKT